MATSSPSYLAKKTCAAHPTPHTPARGRGSAAPSKTCVAHYLCTCNPVWSYRVRIPRYSGHRMTAGSRQLTRLASTPLPLPVKHLCHHEHNAAVKSAWAQAEHRGGLQSRANCFKESVCRLGRQGGARTRPPAPLPTCLTSSYAAASRGYSLAPLPRRAGASRALAARQRNAPCSLAALVCSLTDQWLPVIANVKCTRSCKQTGLSETATSPCPCPQDVRLQRATHATRCCPAAFLPLLTRPRPASEAGALHAHPFRHADVCAGCTPTPHPPRLHSPAKATGRGCIPGLAQGAPAGRPVLRWGARRRSPDLLQHEQLAAALRHSQVPHILSRRLCEALAGMLHRRLGPGLLHQ